MICHLVTHFQHITVTEDIHRGLNMNVKGLQKTWKSQRGCIQIKTSRCKNTLLLFTSFLYYTFNHFYDVPLHSEMLINVWIYSVMQ